LNFLVLFAVARPSVVCNIRAPYSGGSNFRQYFYSIRYIGHPLTSTENFTEMTLNGVMAVFALFQRLL